MRKILPTLILLSLLVIPMGIFAQGTSPECVKLKRDINFEGSKCDSVTGTTPDPIDNICAATHVVGTAGGYCPIISDNDGSGSGTVADQMPSTWTQGGVTVYLDNQGTTEFKADITERWGLIALINTLNAAVDWIFMIMIVLTVLLGIWGAMNIVMAAGDAGKVNTGRNYIMYAAGGLIIAFLARAIPNLVKSVMGY